MEQLAARGCKHVVGSAQTGSWLHTSFALMYIDTHTHKQTHMLTYTSADINEHTTALGVMLDVSKDPRGVGIAVHNNKLMS